MTEEYNGGYPNKGMKKYPNILKYLESHHDAVYKIFDDLGLQGALSPRRVDGITLLLPDKKLIAELQKLIKGDDIEKATDIVQSLILLDVFHKADDFVKKPIITYCRHKLKASVKGNKVELPGGTATKDESFKPFERSGAMKRGNLAVWDFDGVIDLKGAEKSEPKRRGKETIQKEEEEEVKGSGETLNGWLKQIEDAEKQVAPKNYTDDNEERYSPKLKAIIHVLKYFSEKKTCGSGCLCCAKYILIGNPVVDYELLFYNRKIFTDKVLEDALKSMNFGDITSQAKISDYISILTACTAGSYTVRPNISTADVVAAYPKFDKSDQLPKCLSDIYQQHPNLHLVIDESAFTLHETLKSVLVRVNDQAKPLTQLDSYKEVEDIVRDHRSYYGKRCSCQPVLLTAEKDATLNKFRTAFVESFALHLPVRSGALSAGTFIGGEDNEVDDNLIE